MDHQITVQGRDYPVVITKDMNFWYVALPHDLATQLDLPGDSFTIELKDAKYVSALPGEGSLGMEIFQEVVGLLRKEYNIA